jgi:nitroreductase/NAD-dependent dihydropyrimidine dehydrogenase PreA subunit
MTTRIDINHETCDKEGLCIMVCLEDVFLQIDKYSYPEGINPKNCVFCGHCIGVCPGNSITHNGMDMENFKHYSPELEITPEDLLDFLRRRRSVRRYNKNQPVKRELIEKLIEAARYSPTGANVQSLQHIVVQKCETRETLTSLTMDVFRQNAALCRTEKDSPEVKRLQKDLGLFEGAVAAYKAGKDPLFYNAPVVIITHADLTITPCPLEDATLASFHMVLMAESLGLGTCYIGNFYEFINESQPIREILSIPPNNKILMSFTLGYPAIPFRRMVDRNQPKVRWIDRVNHQDE